MNAPDKKSYVRRDINLFLGVLLSIAVALSSMMLPKGLSTLGIIVGIAIFIILVDAYLSDDNLE